jgi:ADP-heptose:LPS heptosyltransferase
MGDFLAGLRPSLDAFPAENVFLAADPARIDHWRKTLSTRKPNVGILWKSLKSNALRDRYFSPFAAWREVLSLDCVNFINLQYGDTEAEMTEARALGFDITTPQGIDLKQDLDDLAALCRACDVVIGPSNATTNIAAACGANVWLLAPPCTWLRLGAENYPWYPKARIFAPPALGDWSPAMADIRSALATFAKSYPS